MINTKDKAASISRTTTKDEAILIVKNSDFFDEQWYRDNQNDLKSLNIDLCQHFTHYGWRQNRAPSERFSIKLYTTIYPDVAQLDINPLIHYELHGRREGRIVLPYVMEVIYNSEYFDHNYYISKYNKTFTSRIEACIDYVTSGDIRRLPSTRFNSNIYLESYKDVTEANVPALLHYELHGKSEGRSIGIAHPDTHYLEYKNPKATQYKNKRICIFAFYSVDGFIAHETLYLLAAIREVTDGIILVGDCGIRPSEVEKIKDLVFYARFERHQEYDFGSYKRAYSYADVSGVLKEVDEILIANDSIVGPCGDINDFFKTRKLDGDPSFYGITINNYGFRDINSHGNSLFSPHIQSYFLTLHKDIFNSSYWKEFIYSVKHEKNKIDIIINYEMGMSKLLSENGHTPASMYKSRAGLNPVARECMDVLNNSLFFKKSMLPGLSPERGGIVNGIFKAKGFPFELLKNVVTPTDGYNPAGSPDHVLKIVDTDMRDDMIYMFAVSEYQYEALEILLTSSEELHQLFAIDINSTTCKPYKGLIEANKSQGLFTYIFKLDETLINRGATLNFANEGHTLQIKYLYGDVPCFDFMNHREMKVYPRIEGKTLHIETKDQSIISIMLSSNYSTADKELYTQILSKQTIAKYSLFTERDSLTSDNAYEFFKYCLSRNENCYYITSKEVLVQEQDSTIQKHLIERGSARHKELLIEAKDLFCAFGYPALLHGAFRDIHMIALRYRLFLMWHGISAGDKDSYEIAAYNGNRSNGIIACSKFESENFKALGHKRIINSGYPRMDKWANPQPLERGILILFFTWRKNLFKSDLAEFVNSAYVFHIKQLITRITIDQPDLELYYFIHNSIPHQHVECLAAILRGVNKKIRFVNNNDTKTFNRLFNAAQHLITDYSSVGYDFAYHKGRRPIFYIPSDFIDGHYTVTKLFKKIQPGIIAESCASVLKALGTPGTKIPKPKGERFFLYRDGLNCERTFNEIYPANTR
jgi:hypothetical protein